MQYVAALRLNIKHANGIVIILSRYKYEEVDNDRIQLIGKYASIAIERSFLNHRLKERCKELELINQMQTSPNSQ